MAAKDKGSLKKKVKKEKIRVTHFSFSVLSLMYDLLLVVVAITTNSNM